MPAEVEPQRPPSPPRPAIVAAWPVPGWLTAPILRIALPATPFGWSSAAGPSRREPPETIGFAEPDAVPPGAVTGDGQHAPPEASPAPETSPDLAVVEPSPVEPSADQDPMAEPELYVEREPRAQSASPTDTPAAAAPTETRPGRSTTAPEVAETDAPPQAGDRPAAEPPPAAAVPPPAAAAAVPPDHPAERPWPRQLNADRPLGAPQAGSRKSLGAESSVQGAPVAEVPALIEPEVDPAAVSETKVIAQPADRTADRTALRNRRLYRRVKLDAGFEIDGAAAQLLDISMGGFAAANVPQRMPEATVATALRLSVDGVEISTRMRARIIYSDTPRSGGRFIDLTASQTALLRYLVTWRGQSVGAIGTTTLLDAITRWPEQALPSAPALPPVEPERRPGLFTRLLGWVRGRGSSDQ